MRTPLIAGNWKMYKTSSEARETAARLVDLAADVDDVDIMIAPTFTALESVSAVTKNSRVSLGGQDLFWEKEGAYTGEISADMLVAVGCRYVIIGHSERRAYFAETDETVNRKVRAALEHQLTPIVCVGETLEENEAGQTEAVVSRQMRDGLQGLDPAAGRSLVIAYEPVWAIGTGLAATSSGANAVIRDVVRSALEDVFDPETAEAVRVLYGGSVKPGNAAEFFAQPDIDGALVGGASLKAEDFVQIVSAAA